MQYYLAGIGAGLIIVNLVYANVTYWERRQG